MSQHNVVVANATALKSVMYQKQMSQAELAKRSGVGQGSISRLLSPHHNGYTGKAEERTVRMIAKGLGVPVDQILLAPGQELPKPKINADGTITIEVMPYYHQGKHHAGYTRTLRPGIHFNKRRKHHKAAAPAKPASAKPAAKIAVSTVMANTGGVSNYSGPAKKLLIVGQSVPTGHQVFDLADVEVFFIG